jgi:ornithine carbamoyltransferase
MKDFLSIADYSAEELRYILELAAKLKKERQAGENQPILRGKVLGMIFQKPSLRTRVSFDMAMRHLGGDALYLSPAEIGLGKRESIADIARVMAGYVEAIMARVFEHDHILELARWSQIPVINGLSDYNHPCQAMADALTIIEHQGGIKGKNVTFIGDGNNVALSLMHICTKLGANFTISTPSGFELDQNAVKLAFDFAQNSGSTIYQTQDPFKAVNNADVIYTDTWTSMGQEDEAKKREQAFPPYQVNQKLVSAAKPNVIVMHCLPAHRGQEITNDVADGPNSVLFPQAHNRLHAQKAILVHLMSDSSM